MIAVNELSTAYGKKQVLTNVSFEAKNGEILGILGENGSGKSTLIKSICNILPHKGSCYLDDIQLEKISTRQRARICSYVPQKSGLELEMSVLDVLLMGFNPELKLFSNPSAKMVDKAKEMLKTMGFDEKINEDFLSLSEGQKQLCLLMRAMVSDSKVLLMDEPENALDVRMRHRMMSLVNTWIESEERLAIIALHDTELALNYCDRLLLIKDGRCMGSISPKSDSTDTCEKALSDIYGKVSIRKVVDNVGKEHLVMLKEES